MSFLTLFHRFVPRLSLSHTTMSFRESLGKLSAPVKSLVELATSNGTALIGDTDKDKTEVNEWIAKVGQGEIVREGSLKVPFLSVIYVEDI